MLIVCRLVSGGREGRTSKDAYMLVYVRTDVAMAGGELPADLRELVEEQNREARQTAEETMAAERQRRTAAAEAERERAEAFDILSGSGQDESVSEGPRAGSACGRW